MTPYSAAEIGHGYLAARLRHVDSVRLLLECGAKLQAVKDSLVHGEWDLWLKDHQAELGFTPSSARRLMAGARKHALARDLTDDEASTLSRQIWGHEPEVSPFPARNGLGYLSRLGLWAVKHSPEDFDGLSDQEWSSLLESIDTFMDFAGRLRMRRPSIRKVA